MTTLLWILVAVVVVVLAVAVHDLTQQRHAILRNFPVIGHARYLLERIGPELRQYIVASNTEERPFDRDQRTWVYESSKGIPNTFGFGTDNELEATPTYVVLQHHPFPAPKPGPGELAGPPEHRLPCAKVLGAARGRRKAFRPASVINVSGMSYGALSANAVESLNRGAATAGCLQTTGEGGIAPAHLHGAALVYQLGTGYFGSRDEHGNFSMEELKARCAEAPVRAIEIKLSQGAKPGLGGLLPAAKVTPEIAEIRGVPVHEDCESPATHSAFHDVDSLLGFVEAIAAETGLPVGIKSAVGRVEFWEELAEAMEDGTRGVDHITIDGGEGGTGAAPLAFTDHVSLPFKVGFARAYGAFARRGIADRVVWIGSGKLGFPEQAVLAFALGCDMVNVGREAMLSIGCIQAQRCHTGKCPTGVTSHTRRLARGLDPDDKSVRAANYLIALRGEIAELCRTCGVAHPALLDPDRVEIVSERFIHRSVREVFGYEDDWRRATPATLATVESLRQGG